MDAETLIKAALREAGYGPDAIGSALPRIMRILQAEDVRLEMGRTLSRKEREYVRLQLELGLNVSEVLAGLRARSASPSSLPTPRKSPIPICGRRCWRGIPTSAICVSWRSWAWRSHPPRSWTR